jgi:hypothetical protein
LIDGASDDEEDKRSDRRGLKAKIALEARASRPPAEKPYVAGDAELVKAYLAAAATHTALPAEELIAP